MGKPFTRTQVGRAFAQGKVRLGGRLIKASYRVEAPLEVEFELPEPEPLHFAVPEAIDLEVIYEDQDVLVINKPAGMVVHAGAGHRKGTLVNAVLYHLRVEAEDLPSLLGGEQYRPGIVHRLDRDTSGLMVISKSQRAMDHLSSQFRCHSIGREYRGIIVGVPPWPGLKIETLHARDPHHRLRFTANASRGRRAITSIVILKRWRQACLCQFRLQTGRTHQIRVHARHVGYPLLADALYGMGTPERLQSCVDTLGRQALHAAKLAFDHPETARRMEFSVDIPPDLQTLVEYLEQMG